MGVRGKWIQEVKNKLRGRNNATISEGNKLTWTTTSLSFPSEQKPCVDYLIGKL